jgi:uncharacterized membrane protein
VPEQWDAAVDMDAAAPPFDRNPSAWSQRWPIAVLAGVGTILSTYMGFFQWHLLESVWDPVFGDGTRTVLTSSESHKMHQLLHVPDAVFGAWGYLSEAVLTMVGSTRRWQFRPWMVLIFGLDVIPLGIVSAVLVVIQGVSIGHWCFLCLVTAAISLTLVFLAYDEVWASLTYLWRVWKRTGDRRILWKTFIGQATPEGERLALER